MFKKWNKNLQIFTILPNLSILIEISINDRFCLNYFKDKRESYLMKFVLEVEDHE